MNRGFQKKYCKKLKNIIDYIKTSSRNKIVLHKEPINGIVSIDIGLKLAEIISNFSNDNRVAMRASIELEKLLDESMVIHKGFGEIVAISNMGILFEPDLKIEINSLFDKYSKNNVLFVQWIGEIEKDALYFLTKEKGIKINLKNVSH